MAFKPSKKGVITGTAKADKITWLTSKDWKKALTVNAGKGNDTINFKKSKYKNNLNGEDGNDKIYGGSGADTIEGGNGNDKLYGYAGNDKIYAGKGNDYIYGGNGNDKIYGQYGKNHLYGELGNDTITGGTGTDYIYGGKGTDTINAGKGTNTIYHSKGDGNDTIISGGGKDTLVLNDETKFNKITVSASGNNVILKRSNGEKITLKDALASEHSVKYVQLGKTKYSIDKFTDQLVNYINSNAEVVNGTDRNDNIYATYSNGLWGPTILAGAGNDTIHITKNNYPEVWVGTGDDTVSLEVKDANAWIYFDNGDGNNVLTGLNKLTSNNANIFLTSSSLSHYLDLAGDFGSWSYITGTKSGNDLALKLTGGETFTIKDYYSVSDVARDSIWLDNVGAWPMKLTNELYTSGDIINIPANRTTYTASGDHKIFVAPNIALNRTITLTANNSILTEEGKNRQTVNINGNNNNVYMYNKGSVSVTSNKNMIYIYGENNHVYAGGGYETRVLMEAGSDGNNVEMTCRNGGYIQTSLGGSSVIDINNTSDYNLSTINSRGTDTITLRNGRHEINISGDGYRNIYINPETGYVSINGIESSSYTNISHSISSDTTATKVMFQDYSVAGVDAMALLYMDDNNISLNSAYSAAVIGYNSFDSMDTAETFGKVSFDLCREDGAAIFHGTLSDMTQYVTMSHYGTDFPGVYVMDFSYSNGENGLFNQAADYYFAGTDDLDEYSYMEFRRFDGTEYHSKSSVINDAGGDYDVISFDDFDCNHLSYFFDVIRDGDNFIVGDDLIFMTADTMDDFFAGTGDYGTITIKDAFGDGKIENICAQISGEECYKLNYDHLLATEPFAEHNTLVQHLISWLQTDGSAYSSISDAMSSDTFTADMATELRTIYQSEVYDYWTNVPLV